MKIVLTGGGTGGHLMPLLSVVEEIRKRDKDAEFVFIGPRSEFNESLSTAGIKVCEVKAGKFRRYFSLQNFADVFNILIGTDQAIFYMLKNRPDVVFSKGGFASIPAVMAASYLKIPILTHESDAVPGLANKIIGRFAKKIFVSFPLAGNFFPGSKIIISGNPIREDILGGDRNRAQRFFGFHENLPVIMVFGGSQGAMKINDALFDDLGTLLEKYQIIHICGSKNIAELETRFDNLSISNKKRYKVFPYLQGEMKDAFALSDFIISRAGASSLSEIIALQKPSLIIPLSSAAGNHQYFNAKYFADKDMLLMLEENELTGGKFLEKIDELANMKDTIVGNLKKYNNSSGGKQPSEIIAEEILKAK